MQKKLLIIAACMIAVVVIVGIVITDQNSEKNRQIEQVLQDDSEAETIVLVSLEEARKEADAVIEAGRNGEYRNLQFNEIRPLITEKDRIYQIRVPGEDIQVTEENLQKELEAIQAFFEEPIDEKKIMVSMSSESLGYISVEQLREGIRNQDEEYTSGFYSLFYENGKQVAQTNSSIWSLGINIGLESGIEDTLYKVYYPGALDGSLQDVYETASGEMSVEEAIRQVENYFNHEFPVPILREMEYRVARIDILKMSDGTYGFEAELRRSYGGVLYQGDARSQDGTGDEVFDLTDAILDGENHVPYFWGLSCNDHVEEIQEITEIISLERAAEYISQKIGDNTVYTVEEIELSYVGKSVEEEGEDYSVLVEEMWPAWLFITVNNTNGKEVRFYVDAVTGEVSKRTMD